MIGKHKYDNCPINSDREGLIVLIVQIVQRDLFTWKWRESGSRSVVPDSLWPHGLYNPWNYPGQNTGVGSLSLLQGIFPTQGSSPGLPHCRRFLYQLSQNGSLRILEWVAYPFSRGSTWPRNQTKVSCIAGRFFTNWAIREALDYVKKLKSQTKIRLPRICLFWLNVKISQLHTSKVNIHTLDGQMLTLMCLLCSHLLNHVWFFETPWTVTQQAPLSMGFSRQEYWSGLPFPTPGELPEAGIKLASLVSPTLVGRFFTTASLGMYTSISKGREKSQYLRMSPQLHVTPL